MICAGVVTGIKKLSFNIAAIAWLSQAFGVALVIPDWKTNAGGSTSAQYSKAWLPADLVNEPRVRLLSAFDKPSVSLLDPRILCVEIRSEKV